MQKKSFEMLWNCAYCGQTKLLGVTHRHCPTCGAAQDPSTRYFPAPGEEVEAQGHVFVGADRACPACSTPMSARAEFCTTCGSPLAQSAEVRRLVDGPLPAKQPVAPRPRRGRKILFLVIGGVVAAIAFFALYKQEKNLTVRGHAWTRAIEIEQFVEATERSECQSMPGGATLRRRYDETRTRQVQVGEDCEEQCRDERVDQGDGTFRVDQKCQTKCKPRYRDEQYRVDMCEYTIGRWRKVRDATAEGAGPAPAPTWPEVELAPGGAGRYGSEREGKRTEIYRLDLEEPGGKRHACEIDKQATWSSLAPGDAVKVAFDVLGNPSCSSLQRR
ncbi:MAG TPA: zinc ribbon domain-containing protein [Haliangium sp.]|nr:zinc ribbon domain-containing protein [Haliangium sp.]